MVLMSPSQACVVSYSLPELPVRSPESTSPRATHSYVDGVLMPSDSLLRFGAEYIVCLAGEMPPVRFLRQEAIDMATELAKRDPDGCYVLFVRELIHAKPKSVDGAGAPVVDYTAPLESVASPTDVVDAPREPARPAGQDEPQQP